MNTTLGTHTTNTNALAALTAEIRKYPTMSVEEEIEKFEEYAKADENRKQELKREIATANLRFVLSVAKKYSNDGDTVAELVSLGTIGLYRAVETFDLSLGFKFISHAIHWIRAEISDYYRGDGNFIRRSNNAKIGSKDKAIIERFIQTEHREPTEDELIEALESEYGIKVLDRVDIVKVKTAFIDEKVGDEDGDTLGEVGEIAAATASRNEFEREVEKEDAEYRVRRLLNGLSVREQEVVTRKFGIGYDREYELDEIAEVLGYTNERCRQILVSALGKMRNRENNYRKLAM
jgi:RNA polymerase primary sigma factor